MATAMTLANPCDTSQAGHAGPSEQVVDAVGQHVLAVHAEAQARDGDAELRRRDVAILPLRIAQHALHHRASRLPAAARASIAARGAPTIANSAATNKRVQHDEPGDDQRIRSWLAFLARRGDDDRRHHRARSRRPRLDSRP